MLDIGTGTGVLAIAAARLFRTQVVAGDIDPVATRAALQQRATQSRSVNGRFLSRARDSRRRHPGGCTLPIDLCQHPAGPPGCGWQCRFAASRRPTRYVVLSGLLPGHANTVLAIYRAQGFTLERRITLEGWVTLLMRRLVAKTKSPQAGAGAISLVKRLSSAAGGQRVG